MYYDLSLGLHLARPRSHILIIGLKDLVHSKKVRILEDLLDKEVFSVLIFNFFVEYFLFHNLVMLPK